MLTQEQKQDFYNRAVAGLASQGFVQSVTRDDAGEIESCNYRCADGKKCALGFLIPDDKYDPSMEGGRHFNEVLPAIGVPYWGGSWDDSPSCGNSTDEVDAFEFFQALQNAHDLADGPEQMRVYLNEFGVAQGLTVPDVLLD